MKRANVRDLLTRLRDAFRDDAEAHAVLDAVAHVPAGLSRRQFLRSALVATAVAATVDVDQLLWMPGERTIFLPSAPSVIAGHYAALEKWMAREAFRILTNNLTIVRHVNREYHERFSSRFELINQTR